MGSFDTVSNPPQSPVFHAGNADRYERQSMIGAYEQSQTCRLAVLVGPIIDDSITLFEDIIYDLDPNEDLHLMLSSPGGDGEAAVRLARSIQARCQKFTVIVPSQAKSVATLLALGSHHIMMAPHSDLGPVDAQFIIGNRYVSAKYIIAAVDNATEQVETTPDTYPYYVSMLGDITTMNTRLPITSCNKLYVQQAQPTIAKGTDQT